MKRKRVVDPALAAYELSASRKVENITGRDPMFGMSDRGVISKGMSNSLEDVVREAAVKMNDPAENEARLKGLFAVLALPARTPIGGGAPRRVTVEVEVAPETWTPIDSISVEAEVITFAYGQNGTRVEYKFSRKEAIPRWRTPDMGHRHVVAP